MFRYKIINVSIQLIQKLVYQLSTNKWTSTIGNWENLKTGNRIRKGKFQEKLIVAHPENLEYLFFFINEKSWFLING